MPAATAYISDHMENKGFRNYLDINVNGLSVMMTLFAVLFTNYTIFQFSEVNYKNNNRIDHKQKLHKVTLWKYISC